LSDPDRSRLPRRAAFVNIGFGNLVAARRVVAVIGPGSSPVKRLRDEARQKGKLLDATQGRRTRAILVTDGGQVVLSAVAISTIGARLEAALGERVDVPKE
jgi:regulator of extracellular matrix RemA (YlzA/DUF370 family)